MHVPSFHCTPRSSSIVLDNVLGFRPTLLRELRGTLAHSMNKVAPLAPMVMSCDSRRTLLTLFERTVSVAVRFTGKLSTALAKRTKALFT